MLPSGHVVRTQDVERRSVDRAGQRRFQAARTPGEVDAGPALRRVLEQLQRRLTAEVMQDLNAAVDLDGRSPRDVAAEHLRRAGLIA